jgi:hypothetical protein
MLLIAVFNGLHPILRAVLMVGASGWRGEGVICGSARSGERDDCPCLTCTGGDEPRYSTVVGFVERGGPTNLVLCLFLRLSGSGPGCM